MARSGYMFTRDGTMWCAVAPGFVNLVESPAGFGTTQAEAYHALMDDNSYKTYQQRVGSYAGCASVR